VLICSAWLASSLAWAQGPADRKAGVLLRLYQSEDQLRLLPRVAPDQRPNLARAISIIDLSSERQDFGPLSEYFVSEVTGALAAPAEGTYVFRLTSDDGAKLWIDGELVIDHDGWHGPEPKEGQIDLTGGPHQLFLGHFNNAGGAQLTLEWRPPGAADFTVIPTEALSYPAAVPLQTAAGPKRLIAPLRRGLPGDGAPLTDMNPAYRLLNEPPSAELTQALSLAAEAGSTVVTENIRVEPRSTALVTDGAQLSRVLRVGQQTLRVLAVWMPPETGADRPGIPCVIPTGPYAGQLLVGDQRSGALKRVSIDEVKDSIQGCVYRFSGPVREGVIALAATPDGKIGGLSAAKQQAALAPTDAVPFELLAVRPLTNGWELEFTQPLDPRVGWDPESYLIERWSWYGYGDDRRPSREGVSVPIKSASVSPDRRRVFLELSSHSLGRVYYFRLLPPCVSESGERLRSTEAWYTFIELPKNQLGEVRTPPPQEPQNVLTDAERAEGWRLLFDGQTLQGWHRYHAKEPPAGWEVRNGCLARVGPGGDVATDESFANFELKLEWRVSPGGNSGIMYHVDESKNWPWETGPEFQVLDNAEHPDGHSALTSAGSNYALYAPASDVTQPVGFFNEARIVVNGRHVEHWLNGVKLLEYDLLSPDWEKLVAASKFSRMPDYGRRDTGVIVLQDHGDPVWYRNIKIRPLGGK